MPTYTAAQRAQISQFVSFTQSKESIAGKFLKNHAWNVEQAVDAFYQGNNGTASPLSQQTLSKLFDQYRDDPKGSPEKIGIEGAQRYLADLGVDLDEVALLALCDLLQCPTLGEFDRETFISGWRSASTPTSPLDTVSRQSAHIASINKRLASDSAYFKQVYRNAFKMAKPENQKSVPMDSALEFWRMFFTPAKGGMEWNSRRTKWLDLWLEFYESKNKRPINKDLWNMVYELVAKTREPGGEDMTWWSEDGAWPMAVDDFVIYVKESRGETMDTS